jgi:transcriptional regulator with XRE-family HTH domain
VEALSSLSQLSSEVDVVTRLAVAGLRKAPYSYSWSEIADRLGVSKQAVQMRYGDRTDRAALDRRLLQAGLNVSVATLVQVFADHHPGSPAASVCPGCGYRYPDKVSDCPTNATVRPLLYRRRGEDPETVARLTADQFADLHDRTTARLQRAAVAVRQAASITPCPHRAAPTLFDNGKDTA